MPKLSFFHKILITHILVFLVTLLAVFPFASYSVSQITRRALLERAEFFISKITKGARDEETLIRRVKDQKALVFFRISLIGPKKNVLYDTATKILLGDKWDPNYVIHHDEIDEAFEYGVGYAEDYSTLLAQDMAYMAKSFEFQGSTFVLRTAFPLAWVSQLRRDYELGILTLVIVLLALSSVLTYLFISYITQPIRAIIQGIQPYQQGLDDHLPTIDLGEWQVDSDFGKLADTLNSLSARVAQQIETLTNERNQRSSILETLNEGVLAVEPDLTITFANHTAHQLLSLRSNKTLGHPLQPETHPTCTRLLKESLAEQELKTEMVERDEGHRKIYLNMVAIPLGAKQGAILVLQDLSSQYELMEMSRDFVANASHELKTPITVIKGWAEALRDNPDLPREQVNEITEKIANNSDRMASLVKDLLELAEIENISETKMESCDLVQIFDECYSILLSMYPDANYHLVKESEGNFTLIGDPSHLERAFYNLFSNAAKYSKGPGEITVRISENETEITVSVEDKGIGIPPEDLDKVFARFHTVDKARSRKLGGTGLGLSIVETIIQKHRGTISVSSELGVGTTFTVVLPKR